MLRCIQVYELVSRIIDSTKHREAQKMLRKIVAKEKSVTEYKKEGGGGGGGEERTEKI